jgi:hypothetical protein
MSGPACAIRVMAMPSASSSGVVQSLESIEASSKGAGIASVKMALDLVQAIDIRD